MNTAGSSTITRTNFIAVAPPILPPVANFTVNISSGDEPLTVRFNDTSSNTPTSWNWSFGDTSYSAQQNPVHTFFSAGNFTVSLNATNAGGSDTVIKPNLISVNRVIRPIANFTAMTVPGTVPPVVQFIDFSTGLPTLWNWSFGDGNISTDQYPIKFYANPGAYDVTLIASNVSGNSTPVTRTLSISPVIEYNQSGTYSVQVPADKPYANIVLVGAGGGGGGGTWWQSTGEGGYGGVAGQIIRETTNVVPGSSISVNVGLRGLGGAGAGGGNAGGTGGTGGQSRFGLVNASGGTGGIGGGLNGNWNGKPGQIGYGSGTFAENGVTASGYGVGGIAGTGRGAGGGGGSVGTSGGKGANGTVRFVFTNIPRLPFVEYTLPGNYATQVPAGLRYANSIVVGAGGGGAGGGNPGGTGISGGQSSVGSLIASGGTGGAGGGLTGSWNGKPGQSGYGSGTYSLNGDYVPGYGGGGIGGTGRGAGGGGAGCGTFGGAGADGYVFIEFTSTPQQGYRGYGLPGTDLMLEVSSLSTEKSGSSSEINAREDLAKNWSWTMIRQRDADGIYAENGSYVPERMKLQLANTTKKNKDLNSMMDNLT